jgi:hypothetical protein
VTVKRTTRLTYDNFMDNSIDVDVDQLLAVSLVSELNEHQDSEMHTGSYDLTFFETERTQSGTKMKSVVPAPVEVSHPKRDMLTAATLGLNMFLDEADEALRVGDLTVDQRIHVATIVSMVEGLTARFVRVCSPDFKAKAPMKLRNVSGT